ncbi:hypothetical protein NEOLI_003843 [Neolecta irregularis DAH-3]|uniref:Uncharacterized protein n=1 Tax=Neolecta irregularis (strain DAH-3) TaxID=1198029 RepID=A0A1U7LN59_NEOID|nr:hypothetical protein NEOLI_003843 [Neolecta irregularis DAH-3]|eukprot:OLL24023.1 hypothetical protein NEOLI_003843 [Neolecta irregularis DAH-3]
MPGSEFFVIEFATSKENTVRIHITPDHSSPHLYTGLFWSPTNHNGSYFVSSPNKTSHSLNNIEILIWEELRSVREPGDLSIAWTFVRKGSFSKGLIIALKDVRMDQDSREWLKDRLDSWSRCNSRE